MTALPKNDFNDHIFQRFILKSSISHCQKKSNLIIMNYDLITVFKKTDEKMIFNYH
jgi:hypothetical protein